MMAPAKALAIVELRRKRLTQARIAQALGVAARTFSRVLARAGLSRLADLERAEPAVAFFEFRPGNISATLVRNLDEPDLWAIQTTWENVGSYRRAYNGYEAKMVLVTLMSEALDEPSAYLDPAEVGDNLPRGE